MKKQGLGNFFRCRNLTNIITVCLLFQARLNPWKAICFMTNPFPKGVFLMELSPNFPFLMLKKQLLHIIYSIFIMSSQTLNKTFKQKEPVNISKVSLLLIRH